MWMDGQRTKTNPKTSPEQSAILHLVQEINRCDFYRKLPHPPGSHFHDWAKKVTSRVHVIQLTGTIFQLNSLFTCFHYIHIEKNAPPTGGHVFSPIWTIFELVRHINRTNVLINFHDDWAKIVTSRVSNLIEISNRTNLLTRFHEDRTINVASRVFKNKCGRTDDGQRPVTKAHLSNQTDGRTDDGQRPVTKAHLGNQVS
ncbi:hypothetical protein DPMN_003713 [Dreissena polymorpha]|uniref:Uncharacterized protein n=1 Tax=Dreissena polymorpha TaxID=45954 RepID=A0A9D4MQE5_DREPO|nr:hypothetical protein DPMN_003713 [Dreissena polymorpha]